MIHVLLILSVCCIVVAFAFALGWWAALQKEWFAPAEATAKVDMNDRCPACGHRKGKLKVITTLENNMMTPAIQHTCLICEAEWGEPTVLKPDLWQKREAVKVVKS